MAKFKFTWGHGVMLGLLSFIAFILTLIFLAQDSIGEPYEDYYEHSLKYQTETIDAIKNEEILKQRPTIKLQANGILIQFPETITPQKGSVYLERGAHKYEDLEIPLTLRNHQILIPSAKLKAGEYEMRLKWEENGVKYLKKQKIEWKAP